MSKQTFRTADLYFAAYCKASGVPYEGCDRLRNKVFFIFGDADGEEEYRHAYFSREGRVAAADYADEIQALKSIIHRV